MQKSSAPVVLHKVMARALCSGQGVTLTSIFSLYQIGCVFKSILAVFYCLVGASASVRAFAGQNFYPCFWIPTADQRSAEFIPASRPYWELEELWHGLIGLAGWKASGDAEQPSDPSISKQESGSALRSSSLRKVLNQLLFRECAFRACWVEDQLETIMKNWVKCYVCSHSNIKLCIFMCVYIHKTTRLSDSSPCQWT